MRKENDVVAVPEDTMILGENQYYSKDCIKTQLNNNVVVVGTSGAGKTRSVVRPNLMQASGSYVVSDPKGNLAKTMGPYLESKGYKVVTIDFIHPDKSLKYNPIGYCHNTTDIRKLAHTLTYELSQGKYATTTKDPFWDDTALLLLCAIIGYMLETDEIDESDKNLMTLSKLLRLATRTKSSLLDGHGEAPLDERMKAHKMMMELEGKESWAWDRYDEFITAPNRTHATIVISTISKMVTFDTLETRKMISGNDIDFTDIGKRPTALFVEVSDTDRSMDILVNLFYTQLMNELCTYADDCCENGCLPVPVQFILDDFATNARIDNFQNMIANIRSRGISAMIMVQSESQLYAGYGDNAQTIIDNCNTYVYMGGSNPKMADVIAKRANKPATRILNMPISMSWIFRRGEEPVLCHNFNLEKFEKEKGFVPGMPAQDTVRDDCVRDEG